MGIPAQKLALIEWILPLNCESAYNIDDSAAGTTEQ